jgi:hypothetical protein
VYKFRRLLPLPLLVPVNTTSTPDMSSVLGSYVKLPLISFEGPAPHRAPLHCCHWIEEPAVNWYVAGVAFAFGAIARRASTPAVAPSVDFICISSAPREIVGRANFHAIQNSYYESVVPRRERMGRFLTGRLRFQRLVSEGPAIGGPTEKNAQLLEVNITPVNPLLINVKFSDTFVPVVEAQLAPKFRPRDHRP